MIHKSQQSKNGMGVAGMIYWGNDPSINNFMLIIPATSSNLAWNAQQIWSSIKWQSFGNGMRIPLHRFTASLWGASWSYKDSWFYGVIQPRSEILLLFFFCELQTKNWVLRVNQLLNGGFVARIPGGTQWRSLGGFSNSKLLGPNHHWIMSWFWRWVSEITQFPSFFWRNPSICNLFLGKSIEFQSQLG